VGAAAAVALLFAGAGPAAARMSVVYDVVDSVRALTGVQPDGSPGLGAGDGLVQQQPATAVLAADRQAGKVSGGAGSALTPSIIGLDGRALADLLIARVDASGAGLAFVDELGHGDTFAGDGAVPLDEALAILQATPRPGGGTYADRVHMYAFMEGAIADPAGWAPFWRALSRSAGLWIEAYSGRTQWAPEQWLAWPRAIADRLAALGMPRERVHVIVRGAGQDAVWRHMRTGAACALLANGPGAYRIEDQAGFVREFRATFGTAPAPAGPSPVACAPAPVLAPPVADALAGVLDLARTGATPPAGGLVVRETPAGVSVEAALGPDPLGLAARLGAEPAPFWAAARARIAVRAAAAPVLVPLAPDGSAATGPLPAGTGPVAVSLVLDGAAVRGALGPPADLALSLAPHAPRLGGTPDALIARPLTWELTVPLAPAPAAGPGPAAGPAPPPAPGAPAVAPRAPAPVGARARVLRRAGGLAVVEVRLSRPVRAMRFVIGERRAGRAAVIRAFRMSGRRALVRVALRPGWAPWVRAAPAPRR
jgi:hypothetical protein